MDRAFQKQVDRELAEAIAEANKTERRQLWQAAYASWSEEYQAWLKEKRANGGRPSNCSPGKPDAPEL
jgi:hypothetical protein